MTKTIQKQTIFESFCRFCKNEQGATSIEYGLIGVLISVGIIVAVTSYADSASALYGYIRTTVTNAINK
jgi:pilus assembly protein Flp/PilA